MREHWNGMLTGARGIASRLLWCSAALLAVIHPAVRAQGTLAPLAATAPRLPESELLPRLVPAFDVARFGYAKPFFVEGEHTFTSGAVLVASEVIFRPGSKLILVPGAAQSGRDAGVYLITRRIVVEAGGAPGIITWAGGATASSSPPPAGKGAPGAAGYDGSPGARGADGANGNPGTAGRAPPIF